jgi:dephospho-CoA kinase
VKDRVVVGVVGLPGAGKSTVASLLASRGARLLDADRLGHDLLEKGSEEYRRVVDLFGGQILAEDGSIDRDRLGRLAFENRVFLEGLNGIVHPGMIDAIRCEIARHRQGKGGPESVLAIDAALLVEWGLGDEVDVLVGVMAPLELRTQRLNSLRGWTVGQLQQREEAQWSEERKMAGITVLVANTGTMDDLDDQVSRLWQSLPGRTTM